MSNDWESELSDELIAYEHKLITNNLPEKLADYIMAKMADDEKYWQIVNEVAIDQYWQNKIDQID